MIEREREREENGSKTMGKRVDMRIVLNSTETIFHSVVIILLMISAKNRPIQVSFRALCHQTRKKNMSILKQSPSESGTFFRTKSQPITRNKKSHANDGFTFSFYGQELIDWLDFIRNCYGNMVFVFNVISNERDRKKTHYTLSVVNAKNLGNANNLHDVRNSERRIKSRDYFKSPSWPHRDEKLEMASKQEASTSHMPIIDRMHSLFRAVFPCPSFLPL